MLPLAGLLGTLVRSQVGKLVATRTTRTLAPASPSGLLKAVGSANPVGPSTRISFGPQQVMPQQPSAAKTQPQPTFFQRASERIRSVISGQQPQSTQQPGPQPTVNQSVSTNGQRFGDVLSGRMTPQQAQNDTKQRDDISSQATGQLFGDVFGSLKMAVLGPGGVIAAFSGLAISGKRFAETMVEANRTMAKHSGTLAVAYGKSDLQDTRRDRASAAATSQSGAALVNAVSGMKDDLAPLSNATTNIMNTIGIAMAKFAGFSGKLLYYTSLLQFLPWIWEEEKKQVDPGKAWINDMAAQYRKEQDQRKDRRRRPPGETVN